MITPPGLLVQPLTRAASAMDRSPLSDGADADCQAVAIFCAVLHRVSGQSELSLEAHGAGEPPHEPVRLHITPGDQIAAVTRRVQPLVSSSRRVLISIDQVPARRGFARFAATVAVVGGVDRSELVCEYDDTRFDGDAVRRWLANVDAALHETLRDPSIAVGRLPLSLHDQEALARWNATFSEYKADSRVEALFYATALRTPARVAVRIGEESCIYAELAQRAREVTGALLAKGVQVGDRVGLMTDRDLNLLPGLLGILGAGAAYVPLDPAFPVDRLAFMIEDAGLRLVATTTSVALRSRLPDNVSVVQLDRVPPSDASSASPRGSANDVAYVIYTSGSTGRPKGVKVPHRAVVNFLTSVAQTPGLSSTDRIAAVTTLSFDIAVLELLLPLTVGAEVVLCSRADASDGSALRRILETSGTTLMQATPTTWRLLIESGWRGAPNFRALCGGEPLPADLAAQLLDRVAELWNLYGPTETTVWSSVSRVQRDAPISIGRPLANTTFYVLDEYRQAVPIDAVGELYIGGDGVALGYLNRPDLTAERFLPDSFRGDGSAVMYRTGDLGRWRPNGELECLGRTDFQVKIRGFRIELGEIETALGTYRDVTRAVVAVSHDQPGDARLVAYIVSKSTIVPEELRNYLATTLPDYMVPRTVVQMAELPLTPNGKVDRNALPAPPRMVSAPVSTSGAPKTAAETLVANAFADVLGCPGIGADEDLFVLGGHSLLVARIAARLGKEFHVDIPATAVFEHPTVTTLSRWIEARKEPSAITGATPLAPRANRQSSAPLSVMQEGIWYEELAHPGRTVFNEPSAHHLRGDLNVAALITALRGVVRDQSSLRTVFDRVDDQDCQVVHDESVVEVPVEDLSQLSDLERDEELSLRLTEESARPFDLTRGPLFRARLFRLAPDHHVFFFMSHHLVWDGESLELFHSEMAARYARQLAGEADAPLGQVVDYADFAVWHRTSLTDRPMSRAIDYWTGVLDGAPAALDVPADRTRPAVQSGGGATEWLTIPRATADRLRRLSSNEGATVFMALLAGWASLLSRITGQQDVVVGTAVRGRNVPESQTMIGFFAQMLPLRVCVDSDRAFSELLRSVKQHVVESLRFEHVPFDHLVRAKNLARDEGRSKIYQAFFSYQDIRNRPPTWGNLRHSSRSLLPPAARQDLAMWCFDGEEGIVAAINFNTDVIDAASARFLATRFQALIDGIVANPLSSVRELLVVSPAEWAQMATWNATTAPPSHELTVHGVLTRAVGDAGEKVAIRCGSRALTFHELAASASAVAGHLAMAGVGRGDVVALHLERTPEMVAAVLGVLQAGAAYLPLDPDFPASRLRFMLQDAGARFVISDGDATSLGSDDLCVLPLSAALVGVPTNEAPAVSADDVAYLIYTSGSTGQPKGVRIPHRAVVNFLASMKKQPGLTGTDRLLAVTTLSFDIAVLELLLPLAVGAEIVLASREEAVDGRALRTLLVRHEITTMQATPATWRLLLEAGWHGRRGFKALCGGEALPEELAARLVGRVGELWNMYGPTESTVWSTCARVEAGAAVTIGRPIDNTRVWILDERGAPVPIGVAGELHVGGHGVALGYHSRPDLTARRFVPDPFSSRDGDLLYRTGDRARWRPDGSLQHLGRTDFQVKVRGYRIELGEVELALSGHPAVAQAVVDVQGDDATLVAYLVTRPGCEAAIDSLREHLRSQLPDFMIPSSFKLIDLVPLTPNGKVDRLALRGEGLAVPSLAPGGFTGPRTAAEHAVAAVWRQLLGIDRIDVRDNFFDLGGHSLLTMRAVTMLEARMGYRISVRALIFQTLEQVAREIEDEGQDPTGNKASSDWARLRALFRV